MSVGQGKTSLRSARGCLVLDVARVDAGGPSFSAQLSTRRSFTISSVLSLATPTHAFAQASSERHIGGRTASPIRASDLPPSRAPFAPTSTRLFQRASWEQRILALRRLVAVGAHQHCSSTCSVPVTSKVQVIIRSSSTAVTHVHTRHAGRSSPVFAASPAATAAAHAAQPSRSTSSSSVVHVYAILQCSSSDAAAGAATSATPAPATPRSAVHVAALARHSPAAAGGHQSGSLVNGRARATTRKDGWARRT